MKLSDVRFLLARGVNSHDVHALAHTTISPGHSAVFDSLGPLYTHVMSVRPNSRDREGMYWDEVTEVEWETLRAFGIPSFYIGLDFYEYWQTVCGQDTKRRQVIPVVTPD